MSCYRDGGESFCGRINIFGCLDLSWANPVKNITFVSLVLIGIKTLIVDE